MPVLNIKNISIKGIAATVPKKVVHNSDYPYLTEKEKNFITKNIGIHSRRITAPDTTASDLCFHAAVKLLKDLNWQPSEISVLIFVSQTPDFITPCTAALLQTRLGLPKNCLAFDINLGCSAYPYGLSVVGSILQNIPGGKGLLLVGDKSSQLVNDKDKSAALLFSDAGSATALQNDHKASPMWFDLCTDGEGAKSLMVKGGAGRHPFHPRSLDEKEETPGVIRHDLNLILKGLDIFKFSVTKIPPSVKMLCEAAGIPQEHIDYFVFHQANKLINQTLGKRLAIPLEKMPDTLNEFGNTSSASIPVTLAKKLPGILGSGQHTILLSGFGVGLSWGTAIIHTENLYICPLIELE